jgi:hypothetical protein
MFTGYAPYDDEGYLLISLRSFIEGGSLYSEVFTQYGPFYYELFGSLFSVTGRVIGMDVGRTLAIAMWVLSSLALGLAAHRMTGRAWIGIGTQLVAFEVSDMLTAEPMHPVALVSVLLAAIVVSLAFVVPNRPILGMAITGAFGSALAMTKVNVGGFALIAVLVAAVLVLPSLRGIAALRRGAAAVAVLLPGVLMLPDLGNEWAQLYALVVTGGIGALVLAVAGPTGVHAPRQEQLRWVGAFFVGAGVAAAAIVVAILPTGVGFGTALREILIEPAEQRDVLTVPTTFEANIVPWALAAVAAGYAVHRLRGFIQPPRAAVAGALRIAAGTVIWASLVPGFGVDVGGTSAPLGIPVLLAWVAALPPRGTAPQLAEQVARVAVVAVAILQALHAYPVAGSQTSTGALVLAVVGGLCIGDGVRELEALPARRPEVRAIALSVIATCIAVVVVGSLAFEFLIRSGTSAQREYVNSTPLRFVSANRVRVPKATADELAAIVAALNASCRTFVSYPGMNSFHEWTGIDPPTGLNTTNWMELLEDDQQREVVDALAREPKACVLYNGQVAAGWLGNDRVEQRPLVRHIRGQFEPDRNFGGGYQLWTRRTRAG